MAVNRPYVLSIAGFDPSGGAGVLADIKTFESHKVYGLGVISANTFQNDSEFERVDWIPVEKIIEQVEVLKRKFEIGYMKIGLIENVSVLKQLTEKYSGKCRIIWDPILEASAGFEFHKKGNVKDMESVLPHLFMITPNIEEAKALGAKSAEENAKHLSSYSHVYLKGGHRENKKGYDTLFLKSGKQFSFRPKMKEVYAKHGSGCVLSSAITANLAKGEYLQRACLKGKGYTEKFLKSNKTLLGFHKL